MADVTLSAAVRQSLLSLQGTTDLIDRTQNRLSTGLRVASAIDDPVAFFQAKTLTDRAFDFNEKKNGIDQGVSTVTAAIDGLTAVENLVRQLKGIAQSLKSATSTQFTDLITQFNDLRSQIDLLTADATYQGTNLINGTGQTLAVEFSDISTSKVSVASVDVRANGLNINSLTTLTANNTSEGFNYADFAATTVTAGSTISVTYVGATQTVTTAANNFTFTYGTATITITASAGSTVNLIQDTTYTFTLGSSGAATGTGGATGTTVVLSGVSSGVALSASNGKSYVTEGTTSTVDHVLTLLNTSLTTLRSNASSLGSNVALLQTRLDFTQKYVNTLEDGGSKLTLADINQEGANLLALQTRQQLGIQALSFAGQAEQSVLGLFR